MSRYRTIAAITTAILMTLTLSMVIAGSAFAASSWPGFRGNEDNNAVVDYETPTEQEYTEPAWVFTFGKSAEGMVNWELAPYTPILVEGDIIEQGTHDQLLANSGFYAELYNSQFQE